MDKENKNDTILFRINSNKKDMLKEKAEKEKTTPSKLFDKWVNGYIMNDEKLIPHDFETSKDYKAFLYQKEIEKKLKEIEDEK